MSKRLERINDEIAKTTAEIIRSEMSDPRIATVVSVTGAKTTADLKYCKISVSVLEQNTHTPEAVMEALKSATGFVRKRIAETINLRHTPEITFMLDDSIAYAMRMNRIMDELVPKE